ncbi:hypothetical protein MAR_005423, partial [Mya arenaria]
GDLNARVKDIIDFIPQDNVDYIYNTKTDYPGDEFCLPRSTKDLVLNKFGLSLIELCCTHDVHLLNGRLFDDKEGNFTCMANNGKSVVDYIVASTELFEHFCDFGVDVADFSDHFPLYCTLKTNTFRLQCHDEGDQIRKYVKYKWRDECKDNFMSKFSTLYESFVNSVVTTNPVDKLSAFIDVFKNAGEDMCVRQNGSSRMTVENEQPDWWCKACDTAKQTKYKLLRRYRISNNSEDLQKYIDARNAFKNICRSKKEAAERSNREKLIDSRNNPKEFWRQVKKSNKINVVKDNNISSETWVEYFSDLYSETNIVYTQDEQNAFEELARLSEGLMCYFCGDTGDHNNCENPSTYILARQGKGKPTTQKNCTSPY